MQRVEEKENIAVCVTNEIFAPVMCGFVEWVLSSAKLNGIGRLYFLARDGWIMYNTARIIAERNRLNIELRYLYCSRIALRNAALSDLGAEAYHYLLEGGFAITPKVVLGRLRLDNSQRKQIYADIGFSGDENMELGKVAAGEFCEKLRKSDVYNDYIKSVSQACKASALKYLEQEGLFDDEKYVLVDSGWTGSMQRMFRVLTGKKQIGYYFGLYSRPDSEDGEFNAYLFDKETSPLLVSTFNNHLFEALCSAPHGMTTGYELKNGVAQPILKENGNLNSESELLMIQERELYRLAESYVMSDKCADMKERQAFAFPLLKKLMFKPETEIAKEYGSLKFSDDPSELYSFPLAAPLENTKRFYFPYRFYEKFFKKGVLSEPLYWGYGSAVLSGKGAFCRANLRLWEILWLIKRR